MARGKEQRGAGGDQIVTPRYPETTPPPSISAADYNLATLQTVMAMQQTLGGLIKSVDTLTEQHKDFAAKLSKIEKQIYAFIAIIIVLGTIIGFFSKFTNDWLYHRTESPAVQQQPPERK